VKINAPREPLYRGVNLAPTMRAEPRLEGRAEGDDEPQFAGSLMHGHFAVFDVWTEIHSWFEGDFLERIAPGAFAKTMSERMAQVRVQFDHGFDYHVGSAPLGPATRLEEDDTGAYYEVPLLDTDYNRDRILPLLQGRALDGRMLGSLLGASFRFQVVKEEWNEEPGRSDHNPDGLPERTITEVRLFEFGPVVFPAYEEATAGVRSLSLTDHYLERTREARSARRSTEPGAPAGAPDPADAGAASGTPADATDEPPAGHSTAPRRRSLKAAEAELLSLRRASQ
jgi:HK97 family phage prohead protease